MSIEYKRTGRFIRMDFSKWLSGVREQKPGTFCLSNDTTNLKDGEVYAILHSIDINSSVIEVEGGGFYLFIWPSEIEALEISLEEALLEMGREDGVDNED